ncbi:hypothetical protein GBAR_LOCUS13698, partial [Geodia barretti]
SQYSAFSVCYACCYFCLIVTCEAPINTSTTFFKSEGSSVMIFCEDGYFIDGSVTSTCVSNGSWVPDLLRIQCEPGNHGSTSAKKGRELVIVGASSAVSLLFLFIVGVAVVFCCCRRKIGKTLCDYDCIHIIIHMHTHKHTHTHTHMSIH